MSDPSNSLPRRPLRVAAAQAQPVAGNVPANVAKVVELLSAAADQGVELVVFPEKFLSGYEPELVRSDPDKCALADGDGRLAPILDACRRRNVSAVVGAATRDGARLHISSIVCSAAGAVAASYHKQHLFSSEKQTFARGETGCVLQLGDWRLGLAICYDAGFAEHARGAALHGSHAYLVSALFSVGNGHHESRIWMPARALDNTMYVVMSNHVGTTGGWNACGSSGVWGPYGNLVTEAGADTEGLAVAELDPGALSDMRRRETMLADAGDLDDRATRYVDHRIEPHRRAG